MWLKYQREKETKTKQKQNKKREIIVYLIDEIIIYLNANYIEEQKTTRANNW